MSRLDELGAFFGYAAEEIGRVRTRVDEAGADDEARRRGEERLRELIRHLGGAHADPTAGAVAEALGRFARVEVAAPGEEDRPLLLYIVCDQHRIPARERDTASLLLALSRVYPFRVVCVEGSDGVTNAGWLKSFPLAGVRLKVAGMHLDRGELTGEEFFLLASEHVFLLYGVDSLHFRSLLETPGRWKWGDLNRIRSRVMLKRCLEKMEDLGERIGVLVTTNFHYFELAPLARDIGLAMLAFWPRGSGAPYDAEPTPEA